MPQRHRLLERLLQQYRHTLTPYDILRLSRRLGITTSDFLVKYTFPYEIDPNGIAGVKLKPVDGGSACQFMVAEGCSVYEDRPTSCRYYPVALVSNSGRGLPTWCPHDDL